MPDRPNVLFVMADQHRGDAVGADPACPPAGDGAPAVHTPNIDHFVDEGALFSRAYTPVPSCIPARRCLWTGMGQDSADAPNWTTEPWAFEHTLPRVLRDAGYQTHLAGKSHSQPLRNHFGFEGMDLHAGGDGDYATYLDRVSDGEFDEISHGLDRNSWDPRQNHLPEHLDTRDPTRPFFLTVSYHRPHQPFDPPEPYWEMYRERDLPAPDVGAWADRIYGEKVPANPDTNAWCADLPAWVVERARAGYYGSITHVDHQLNRILDRLGDDTLIVYTSDHGEMLGDHYLWRKTYAYEGSARVPMVVQFPGDADLPRGQTIDRPVGLEDLMPTVLDYLDIPAPDTVEGRSLLDLVVDPDREDWRPFYHGEHGPIYDPENACQYLVGDRQKYVYNPITGDELLFDLVSDPGETTNLAADDDHADELGRWRDRLVETLSDRPEGLVADGELQRKEPGIFGETRFRVRTGY
ncbi:MAG: sulfatase-like hydrolase/transferase [Halobacteriaceae archaeon]